MNNLNNLNTLNYFSKQPIDSIYYAGTGASLDLNFARNKSLMDRISGNNLVTFTRTSGGTFVDSAGVLRSAVTNLLLRSEEFDNASWLLAGTLAFGSGSIANATTAPNGTTTAEKLVEASGGTTHFASQQVTISSGTVYTLSVYAKAAERSRVALYFGGAGGAAQGIIVNLTNGTFAANIVAAPTSYSITSAGNGWYRISITATSVGTVANHAVYICNDSNAFSYSGDGTSGIYLWGAQLEQSSIVGEYIPTGATINSAPRFDHNPTTGESLGLLVEEQRTNEVRNSNNMSAVVTGSPGTLPSGWSSQGNSNGWTREVVGSGSIGAMNYVDIKLSGTPTISTLVVVFQGQNIVSASNGQTWAVSIYHQLVAGSMGNIIGYPAANMWSSGGAYLGSLSVPGTIQPSSVLQRYTGSATIGNASTAFISWGITFVCTIGQTYDFTIRFALPQLERGAFATSVIPTTGTAATRSADVASVNTLSPWYNATEGSIYVEGSSFDSANATRFYTFNDGTLNNVIRHTVNGGTSIEVGTIVTSGSSVTVGLVGYVLNTTYKRALGYKLNDSAYVRNGTVVGTLTSVNIPSGINNLQLGSDIGFGYLNGYLRRLTYFPQRISNANLQRITQ